MKKITFILTFLFFSLNSYSILCAQENIDVEMLGLDNIDEKIKSKDLSSPIKPENKTPFVVLNDKDKEKLQEKNEAENNIIAKNNPNQKEEEVEEKIMEKGEEKSEEKSEEKEVGLGIFDKIKGFVDKKTDHEKKKITIKLIKEKKSEEEKGVQVSDEDKIKEKLAKEKKERLDKLRETYLIKISQENLPDIKESGMVIPQKKELSWSDSFNKTVDMPPPIISRSRTEDNSHIPIIPTFREKVDGLFSTIRSDDINAFNHFYSKIAIPDLRNQRGDTILTYALLLKRHPVVSSILSKGADPDLANSLGHTPLDIAIENLDLKSIKILIDNRVDISYTDKYNRTYLMLAARKGYLPIVQILVENGAKVNEVDSHGRTALNIAYRHKKEVVAKYLLKNGAKTWVEKPFDTGDQQLIKELENRWKKPVFNSQ